MSMVAVLDAVPPQAELESRVMSGVDCSRWPDLVGSQTPRLSNYPAFFSSMADDGVDYVEMFGYTLLPWQEALFRHSLGETVDGLWSARNVLGIITRQQGKTQLIEARELFGLFELDEKVFHTAQQFKTANMSWQAMRNLIETYPELSELCMPHKGGAEETSIRLKGGDGFLDGERFIRYIARSPNFGRDFRDIDLVVCDEAYALSNAEWGSLGPTQRANRNPQTWFTSSAGTDDSEMLSRLREMGVSRSDPSLLFAEWSLAEGSDPADRALWPIAQASLGAPFCSLRNLESEFTTMDLSEFAREHMGMWDDPRVNSVIPLDAWQACALPDLADGSQPVVDVEWTVACVDVAPDRAWASIALAGKRPDGRSHVELLCADEGTAWIVPQMQRLISSSMPPRAVALQAGGQAGGFCEELEQIGFKVHMFSPQAIAASTAKFYDDIVAGALTHLDDPSLVAGLSGATKYSIGKVEHGGWGWLRKGTSVDITGIVACSYANRVLVLESAEGTLSQKKRFRMV